MPAYRRLSPEEGGKTAKVYCRNLKKEIEVDNSFVVPYNRFLLAKYQAHINCELVGMECKLQGVQDQIFLKEPSSLDPSFFFLRNLILDTMYICHHMLSNRGYCYQYKIIGSKQKVLILGTELFAWNSSPDESQRTEEGR